MNDKIRDLRNGVLCCLIFLGCYWAAWPVAQMGFIDDWSYIRTTQVFAQTGHIAYNGWAAPILGWMIPWGALFIKLFGFTFMTVKLSTLPVAVATLLLFHSILRRFEITPRNAVIGTLTLGLSPLFLPLSASFMTDIPGLFVIVLCLYLCQRALATKNDRAAMAWLVAAAVTNVVGGTARQVAWLGVLVMVPCTGWLLRNRRKVFATAAGLWLAGVGAIVYCMHWFVQQPYVVQVKLLPRMPDSLRGLAVTGIITADLIMAESLCLLLILLPVLIAWLPQLGKKLDHYLAFLCAGLLPMIALRILMGRAAEIWPPVILLDSMIAQRKGMLGLTLDKKHFFLPVPAQMLISLLTLAALFGCIAFFNEQRSKVETRASVASGRPIFWLLLPYAASYCGLVLLLMLKGLSFGRYMVALAPVGIALSLWAYQNFVRERLPQICIWALVAMSLWSVACTHDWFAWQRARLAAIGRLRSAGVARTAIQAGMEFDGWTQVEDGGHVNNPAIVRPKGAYQKTAEQPGGKCTYIMLKYYSRLRPEYAVGFGAQGCDLPSRFPDVHYTAWLPPFRRTVAVQRVPGSSH